MKRFRWIMLFVALAFFLSAGWLLWARPKKVDMAGYAPANALLYLESNEPMAVVQAIVGTDAWKLVDNTGGVARSLQPNPWFQRFVEITGIGPIQSVLLSRAQVGFVILDLGMVEEGATLRVKPEAALIIETHTSETRIRPVVEQALRRLAEATYDNPTSRRILTNGVEFLEWRSAQGSRQIVAAIAGSLVVVGNSEKTVLSCLNTARQGAPSLKDDANLHRLRRHLAGTHSLAFGYVPQERSARLLSVAMPLILGRTLGDVGFQKVVAAGASKLVGSVAWTSKPFQTGIEDRYLISLKPSFLEQLRPSLGQIKVANTKSSVLPENIYSVTYYRFKEPVAAWEGLKTSASSHLDAFSAIVFSSVFKSALLSYGINEPDAFLRVVNGDILTLRLDPDGDHVMFIAGIKDREALRELVTRTMKLRFRRDGVKTVELFVDARDELAVSFLGDVVTLGTASDVRLYLEKVALNDSPQDERQLRRISFFAPLSNASPIVTYANDSDRVRRFVSAISAAGGSRFEERANIERLFSELPYAATQTTLVDEGFERVTRSPLGQFSTLLPLLIPDERIPTRTSPPSQ